MGSPPGCCLETCRGGECSQSTLHSYLSDSYLSVKVPSSAPCSTVQLGTLRPFFESFQELKSVTYTEQWPWSSVVPCSIFVFRNKQQLLDKEASQKLLLWQCFKMYFLKCFHCNYLHLVHLSDNESSESLPQYNTLLWGAFTIFSLNTDQTFNCNV